MRTILRVNAAIAGVQALLRIGPIVVLAMVARDYPHRTRLTIQRMPWPFGSSPAVMIVAGLICAIGGGQVFVVLALAERLKQSEHRRLRRVLLANDRRNPLGHQLEPGLEAAEDQVETELELVVHIAIAHQSRHLDEVDGRLARQCAG